MALANAYLDVRMSMVTGASIAALVTWAVLNRFPIRGDKVAAFYIAAIVSQYVVFRQSWLDTSIIASVYIASSLLYTTAYRFSPYHPLARFPGPRMWWASSLILSYISTTGRRHLIIDALHKIHGPFMRIGPNTLSINAITATSIYSAHLNMEKGESYRSPGYHDGNVSSIFVKQKTNKIHSNRKKIWSAGFTSAALSHYYPHLETRLWELMKCIEIRQSCNKSKTVDIFECFSHWSFDFMGDMMFGGSSAIELMKNGDNKNLIFGGKIAPIMLDTIGHTPWLMDVLLHVPKIECLFPLLSTGAQMMRTRIQEDKDITTRDFSSYLLDGDPKTGEKLSQADLELDAAVAIQTGSDDTAAMLTLAFYFMLVQPKYYLELQAELDSVFADRSGHLDPTALSGLNLLNAIINETLRLSSPFFLPRIVPSGGFVLDGRHIPGGTTVAIATHSLHTSPVHFSPMPQDFLPERWIPGVLGKECHTDKNAFMPFSSGPHACIGKNFAYQQLRLIVARLVLAYDMKFADGFDSHTYLKGTVPLLATWFRKPLLVKVIKRSGIDLDKYV